MSHFVSYVIVSSLIFSNGIIAQENEGDTCNFQNGANGQCKLLNKCPSVYQDLLRGKSPEKLCGFSGYDPVVCCPNANVTPFRPITEKPRTTTESEPVQMTRRTFRPPKPTRRPLTESRNPGDLARQKCAEYAESVFVLKETPALAFNEPLANVSLCGVKAQKLIVGGTIAESKEFPHMAAVGFNSRRQGIVWLCGGTLVSEKYVLTAAHCTHSLDFGKAVRVRVGDLNLVQDTDEANPQEREIAERIRHPLYKKPSEYHDIALLRMESPVNFDAFTRPACLPINGHSEGSEAIATGWGRVDWTDEEGSNDLLKVTLRIVDIDTCNSRFIGGSVDFKLKRGVVDDWQICAGGDGRDTCQGDSGGPLAIYDPNHYCMYDVVGVTSLGRLCGSIAPGVYTRVHNYISWLEDTIWRS